MSVSFGWIYGVLVAVDQLGNAIANGNPDVTISARVGFNSRHAPGWQRPYWLFLEKLIDFTFYPIHGEGHCLQSLVEDCEEHHDEGSDVARAVLGLIVVAACLLLIPVIRFLGLFLGPIPKTSDAGLSKTGLAADTTGAG